MHALDITIIIFYFILMIFLKGVLVSMAGPTPNYAIQHVLSTRSPREAALENLMMAIAFGFATKSVHSNTELLVSAIIPAFVIPNVIKWHWWRFNGHGFFAGMVAMPIFLVIQQPRKMWLCAAVFAVTSAILKFTWYDNLEPAEKPAKALEILPSPATD